MNAATKTFLVFLGGLFKKKKTNSAEQLHKELVTKHKKK